MDKRCFYLSTIFLTTVIILSPVMSECFADAGTRQTSDGWTKGFLLYMNENQREGKMGTGWAMRKKALLEYATFVTAKNEISLREFTGGDDAASRAIGQGKAALVFYLLRRMAGEEKFSGIAAMLSKDNFAGKMSWDDVRIVFEKETGRDLGWFFKQWVDRRGLPDLHVENVSVRRNGSTFEVSFDVMQKGEVYLLDVPVSIVSLHGGTRTETVKLDGEKKHVSLFVEDEPSTMVIDGDYDVPRKLWEGETPPLLAKILGEKQAILVQPVSGAEAYSGVIEAWKQRGAEVRKADRITDEEIRTSSFVVLGNDNPFLNRLYGKVGAGEGELSLTARKNPWNPDKIVVIIRERSARPTGDTVALLESGNYSSLSMDIRGVMTGTTTESERGMLMELRTDPLAVDVAALKTLSRVMEQVAGKKIVYVGEYHDRFSHHTVQLQFIKSLYRKNAKIAIGMEMFQRPFQRVLDEYISGGIEEREFLKKSEYFRRWSFDYNLYKPILDFARAEKIPVIALNLQREITDKVAKSGLDSLTDEEKKEIPQNLDFSDADYRERLRQAFEQHKSPGEKNFDFFVEAQVLWDETMALSIDNYLQKNPERQMVVVAGLGHIAYGSGIPKRVLRRNGFEFAVVLNDADVDRDIGDYLIFPPAMEGVTAPKLMAVLKENDGQVGIADFPEDSVSRNAGIKVGDILIALDNMPVRSIDDIKIELFYKQHGETVKVKVARKRFLLGDTVLAFDVKLP